MAHGPKKWTEAAIARLYLEGRGKGEGQSYKPWIEVLEVSSIGRSRRVAGIKTGREHQLLSDVEWGVFLRGKFRDVTIKAVTGELTSGEREAAIEEMGDTEKRILVATDCLSEGINLQHLFTAVVHYDLSWNPTRHEQREGRVDRFGQKAREVRSTMLYGEDNPVDGAVLQVILRKAESIRKELGVLVPTGAAKGGLEPYSLTVLGGEMTLCEPARYLPPEQVKRIAEALTNLPEQALRDRFDSNAMEDAEIYPRGVWVRDGPRVLDYVLRHYQDLVAFYQASALRGDGALVWIG